jgi:hypothetical protein
MWGHPMRVPMRASYTPAHTRIPGGMNRAAHQLVDSATDAPVTSFKT